MRIHSNDTNFKEFICIIRINSHIGIGVMKFPKISIPPQKLKTIGIIAGVAVLLILAYFGWRGAAPAKVTLEFWSSFDNSDIYEPFFEAFKEKYPHIEIKYYKKAPDTYEKELIDALAAGRGPDFFSIHNTWLPKHGDKLSPMPEDMMLLRDYKETFVDVVYADFVEKDAIYAVPFFVDTLALYYNKDYFNAAGIALPPATWDEFVSDVIRLTVRDNYGNITRAGAAIGTVRNINRSTDILSLLMLQNSTQMANDTRTQANFHANTAPFGQASNSGLEPLNFYTSFADARNAQYTWNTELDYSIDMFWEGRAAMMFNYAYNYPTIVAKSPHLNFAVAPMPQSSSRIKDINYANYWGQAVSKVSKHPKEAWQFILWMAEQKQAADYTTATGRPVARRDLISSQRTDTRIGVFADQALTAVSWYEKDNSAIENIFADMIEDVVRGIIASPEAIDRAAIQVTVLMSK